MKNALNFLFLLTLIISCSIKNRNQTGKDEQVLNRQDTLVLQKIVTNEIAGSAYSKKAIEYSLVVKNDTLDFKPVFVESNEDGMVSIYLNLPYANKTQTYSQRTEVLKLILGKASEEFNFDSLSRLSVGRLILTGDLAIEITEQYKSRYDINENITTSDYNKISVFLLESRLTTDLNKLFHPYSKSVEKINIEKAFFTTKNDLLKNSKVEKDTSEIPDRILDCIVWVSFKNE